MVAAKNSKKILLVIAALLLLAIVISKSGFIENLAGQQEQTAGTGIQLNAFFAWQALVVLITLTAIIAIILQFTSNNKTRKAKR